MSEVCEVCEVHVCVRVCVVFEVHVCAVFEVHVCGEVSRCV